MKSINHAELKGLIKETYKKKLALFVWGTTGIGKSDTVREVCMDIAKEKGLKFNEDVSEINSEKNFSIVDIRISQLDISDLRGLPKIEDNTTKWLPPNWLPDKSHGILFFDELNLSVPAIQSSAYQLILDRRLGDYVLPDGWVIISAGNRVEDKANIFEMSRPLQNRFLHAELEVPSVDKWIEWGINHDIDTRIATFLKFKPSLLFKFDGQSKDKSFPTPRSWEFCSKLINDVDSRNIEKLDLLISCSVGEASGIEFTSWLKLKEKLNIKGILDKPLKAKLPAETDLIFSMVSGVLEYYKKDRKLIRSMVQLATRLKPEFAVMMLKLAKTYNKKFVQDVIIVPEWKNQLAKSIGKYF